MQLILKEVEKYIVEQYTQNLPKDYLYHNLNHTLWVIEGVETLCKEMEVEEEWKELLIIAAWFHDIGYLRGKENHEILSMKMATDFLSDKGIEKEKIDIINRYIECTMFGVKAENLYERIIQDADFSHFASKSFSEKSEMLRKEIELTENINHSDKVWTEMNIDFFKNKHQFKTVHALKKWEKQKQKNLISLYKELEKSETKDKKNKTIDQKLKKGNLPERGVETMFRVTLRNHISLSQIADSKANILLSVNAIIVSLVFSNLFPKLDNPTNNYLIYPTIIFVVFTISTIVLSIMATKPNVSSTGRFTRDDVVNRKVNLLFFGNFHSMQLGEFEWAISELMKDRDFLYSSMAKDLYFLGKVLNKKYRLLSVAYIVFMTGIIVSVLSFAVAFRLFS